MDLTLLRDYQLTAHRTAIYPRRKDPSVMADSGGVIYTVLGLCGECGEYYTAFSNFHLNRIAGRQAVVKEAGDVCWYMVELLAELDVPVDVLINSEAFESGKPFKLSITYACGCAELVKKGIRDNGRINSDTMVKIIANLQMMWASLNFDLNICGLTIEEVLEENNKKLLSRLERGTLNGSGDNR